MEYANERRLDSPQWWSIAGSGDHEIKRCGELSALRHRGRVHLQSETKKKNAQGKDYAKTPAAGNINRQMMSVSLALQVTTSNMIQPASTD